MIGFELTLITLISPNWGIHHCLWHNDFNVLGDGHSNRIFFRRMSAVFIPMRRTMKKFNKLAMVLASAALATAASAQSVDNWRNGTGEHAWKNGSNELCWRDANWTPATAAAGCDGAIAAPRAAAPAPARVCWRAPSRLLPQVRYARRPQSTHQNFQPCSSSIAALRPLMPTTPPPGCVHAPHRNTPGIGVRCAKRLSHI